MTSAHAATYRAISEGEHEAAKGLLRLGFSMPAERERFGQAEPTWFRVVEAGGELVTSLIHARLGQWWLGGRVPSAQVVALATPPQHRGYGYGTRLLQGLFDELHGDGVATVTLFASTAPFYRGAGFEYAGDWTLYEARAEHLPRTTAPYRARQAPLDDFGEIRELYARVAPGRHGALDRDEAWWRARFCHDDPVAFVLDGPDGPAGWLIADLHIVEQPVWGARARVRDWGGLPGTQAALLGLLGGYGPLDGVATWSGPDPDPALLALPERSFSVVRREPWMLRVVDVPAAFTARPYPAGVRGRVGFTVQDPLCPWNSGAWLLEVDGGQGQVERAPEAAASAHVRGLAALFTGYQDPADLAAAGLLGGLDEAALGFLRDAFTTRRPWTAEHY
jgi:predicted acetyltransferase